MPRPLFLLLLMLPGPDDGKVTVAATRLEGLGDFLVVHSSHTWLAWRGRVITQIRSFLRNGRFDRPAEPDSRN